MAAPTGPRGSQAASPPGFEGFPFAVGGRQPEESAGKEQEQTGGVKKKPCRACTDFKSWMKVQKKQTTSAVQVTGGHGWLTGFFWGSVGLLLLQSWGFTWRWFMNWYTFIMLFSLKLYQKVCLLVGFMLLCQAAFGATVQRHTVSSSDPKPWI